MPIQKRWTKMTDEQLSKVPNRSGVYELSSFGENRPVYIGQTNNLQQRLRRHKQERNPNHFRFETAGAFQNPEKMEQEHIARFADKHGTLPSWNTQHPSSGSSGWGAVIAGGVALGLLYLLGS